MPFDQADWERRRRHLDDQLAIGEIAEDAYAQFSAALYAEQDAALHQRPGGGFFGMAVGGAACLVVLALWFVIFGAGVWLLWTLGAPGWAYPVWTVVYVFVLPGLAQAGRR